MKMLHVTIQTAKFEETIRFYREVAGLEIQSDMRPQGRNIVFLADSPGKTCVEIIENPAAADSGSEHLSVGFQADDVESLRLELEKRGYAPTPMVSPAPGVKFFFVKDPAGVKVQFM